jgi:hypothetical protein
LQGLAPAGEVPALGAVDDGEQPAGWRHARLRLGEQQPGEGTGAVKGRGVKGGGGQGGESRHDLRVGQGELGPQMSSPVQSHGALADAQAKFGAHAGDDVGIGAVFVPEPDAQPLPLRRTQPLQFGIAADFPGRGNYKGGGVLGPEFWVLGWDAGGAEVTDCRWRSV